VIARRGDGTPPEVPLTKFPIVVPSCLLQKGIQTIDVKKISIGRRTDIQSSHMKPDLNG
jgi:hypothetical protein